MKLVNIDGVWINPKKVIMVQEVPVNPGIEPDGKFWVEITLEGSYPREHPANCIIDEPNIIYSCLPLDEVAANINGGLE